jgi:hypothetical protein
VPLTQIANEHYTDPRQRTLFKNIIYVGALSMLLNVDAEVFEKLFAEQYKGKERLLDSNVQALHLGRDFVKKNLPHPLGIRVHSSDKVGDQIFTDGNSAAALGCIYGGATVCAWYPITPSSSIRKPSRSTATSTASIRPPARTALPSSRLKMNSPPSAWPSARAGTARARSPPLRALASA